MVVSEPSWPVFIACSMSSASPPRASPTMMRSGPGDGGGRDDGVHAGAVGQPRVDQRRVTMEAPADRRHEAVDQLHQVILVAELDVGEREPPLPLDVDGARTVDEDVGDVAVLEELLERAQPEDLVADLLDQPLALEPRQIGRIGLQEALEGGADVLLGLRAVERGERHQVEALEELAVHAQLQLLQPLSYRRAAALRRPPDAPVVDAHRLDSPIRW